MLASNLDQLQVSWRACCNRSVVKTRGPLPGQLVPFNGKHTQSSPHSLGRVDDGFAIERYLSENVEDEITKEEFDHTLALWIGTEHPVSLLEIPGVYDILAAHFKDEVIEHIKIRRREGVE
jgi:hypothetical protein